MQTCVIDASGNLAVVERPEPTASDDIVKVMIEIVPMCTEFKELSARRTTEALGHEAIGVVAEAEPSAGVKLGQRVVVMSGNACNKCATCQIGEHIHCRRQRNVLAETGSSFGTSTYAQYVLKPGYLLLPVPDDISSRHAALTHCGLGPSLNALVRMRARAGETIVISGCGPVGLGSIVNSIARGMRVIASEPKPYRAKLALELGASAVVDPATSDLGEAVSSLTEGQGADCAIETSGLPFAAEQAMRTLRPLGRLALLAWDVPVRLPPLIPQGLEVHGCWHWNHARDAELMWSTVRKSGAALDVMLTHAFRLDQALEAMKLQQDGNCGKVILYPNDSDVRLSQGAT